MQQNFFVSLLGGLLHWPHKRIEIDEALWSQTISRHPFLQHLSADELARLKSLVMEFLASKEFFGAGGLPLTDEISLAVAVQGCLLVLNLGLDYYKGWVGIIIYPDQFIVPRTVEDEAGVVHQYTDIVSGEAWDGGPLIISWRDAQMAGDGYNVILHEFAHKLDMADGLADGMPPLGPKQSQQRWHQVLHEAYEDFCKKVDTAGDAWENTLVFDPYASESPEEFFAVMSEAFFETPEVFHAQYPDLFEQFSLFYRQDPLKAAFR